MYRIQDRQKEEVKGFSHNLNGKTGSVSSFFMEIELNPSPFLNIAKFMLHIKCIKPHFNYYYYFVY